MELGVDYLIKIEEGNLKDAQNSLSKCESSIEDLKKQVASLNKKYQALLKERDYKELLVKNLKRLKEADTNREMLLRYRRDPLNGSECVFRVNGK